MSLSARSADAWTHLFYIVKYVYTATLIYQIIFC